MLIRACNRRLLLPLIVNILLFFIQNWSGNIIYFTIVVFIILLIPDSCIKKIYYSWTKNQKFSEHEQNSVNLKYLLNEMGVFIFV
jgi:hypothetical protein